MYNKFANVTTPHCHFPASWLTFCTFAAAMASFRSCTLPDSMAFLSALAACTDHSSQYAFNIRNWLATGHFCLLVEKKKTRKCMKIADLHNARISGKELETTKAGHQTRKMCSTFKISFVPNEHLQKQTKLEKTVLGIWHFGSALHVELT